MVKISLSIIVIFGCCVLSDGLRCCTCSNDNTIDVSYRECKNNNTCKWTCSVTKKCGPLFWDPSAKEGPPNVTFDNIWVLNPRQDETITLPCQIRSNPEANVTWMYNGRDISSYSTSHVKINKGDCSSFLEAKAYASGLFTCLVQNAYGFENHTFKVDVEPHVVQVPSVKDLKLDTEDNMAYLGSTFNLSCTVAFNPTTSSFPQIAFIRHGQRVWDIAGKYENFPGVHVDGNRRTRKLSLKNVTIAEEGNWSCYGLENGLRGDRKTLNLIIVPCPAGYYCPWNESTKHECPYGTYTNGMANFTYKCTECPGQYPSSKPKGYSGPAKSIKECPVKVSAKAYNPTTTLIVGISISSIIVLIVVSFKFKKQLKQFLLKTISVDNLSSGPELVINDFCAYDSEQRLFTSATAAGPAEAPEFPILYDVFISHSSKDVTFATEIQTELELQDFKCCIHIRDFTPGETILDNISNAIYGSRVTLAILSPDFVDSEWCKGELQQALTRSMRDHRVIPILYKNCQIPKELLHRTYIDYENCYVKPYFWDQLIKVLRPMRLPMTQSSV